MNTWSKLFKRPQREDSMRHFKTTLEALIVAELDVPTFDVSSSAFDYTITIDMLARNPGMLQMLG